MRRRSSSGATAAGGTEEGRQGALGGDRGWAAGWADSWGEGEQERVARWLTARGRTVSPSPGPAEVSAPAARRDPWEALDGVGRPDPPQAQPVAPHRASRPEPHPAQDSARAALAAEVTFLKDERRRLAAALEAERREAERVRGELRLAATMIEEQIAGLEEDRRRALAGMEAAVAAAEQARADERAARAGLDGARAEARAVEAKHFEVWVALDEEVAALAARRRRLRALRRRLPRRPPPPPPS
ncbi:MAG TPA: hypothetical protein VM263_03175 [Acidimicrobiales bacterium]|nr:hypothetical protein [Acidimicrobiales bacterium]